VLKGASVLKSEAESVNLSGQMGLRISHRARRRLGVRPTALGPEGELRLPDVYAARLLAQELNDHLGEELFTAGRLNALSRLERIARALLERYSEQQPEVWAEALESMHAGLGAELDLF
jgi:hypothetical protein